MARRTLYSKDHLQIMEEPDPSGDKLVIAEDRLVWQGISLTRKELAEVMPLLAAWLRAGEGGDFLDYARQCRKCGLYYELIGRDDGSIHCRSCHQS